MLSFYNLKVKNVVRETEDTVTLVFDVPEEIKNKFSYKQGQYLTIRLPLDGKDNRRAYSLSSSPITDEDLTVTIKKIDDGLVSNYLNEKIQPGEELFVMPPQGNFTFNLNKDAQKLYFMIAGGSGITPLMSMIKSILAFEKNSIVTLIYSNKNENTIIFKNALDQLEATYHDRFKIHNVLSRPSDKWNGLVGRLNSTLLTSIISEKLKNFQYSTEFYLCGPSGLMKEVELALFDLNIPVSYIHKENFVSDTANKSVPQIDINNMNSENTERKVKLIMYGEELFMDVLPDDTITVAAQKAGFDPPYSCQIGACSTCRAKLKSGEVIMDECDSLTQDEIDEGYILTCQSHPVTDDVVIDFDDN